MSTVSADLFASGDLQRRAETARILLQDCRLCPRSCGVNRLSGELGACRTGGTAVVSSYGPHFGEESPLVGTHGSGTVFLASCSLRCCFCQNYDISHSPEAGRPADALTLAAVMLELQDEGCHNINFVTPTHVVPQLLEALVPALENGLDVPLVYNSSGYEQVETLRLLDGVIDIYMPDFKFWESTSSAAYLDAADYPEMARLAVAEMHRQVGDLKIDAHGIATSGLLVRHLLMPGAIEESGEIFRFLAAELSPSTYVNVMDQYRPCGRSREHPEIARSISAGEYRRALELAERAGLTRLDERNFHSLLKHLGLI